MILARDVNANILEGLAISSYRLSSSRTVIGIVCFLSIVRAVYILIKMNQCWQGNRSLLYYLEVS